MKTNNIKLFAQSRGASRSVRYNYVCESSNTNKKQNNVIMTI